MRAERKYRFDASGQIPLSLFEQIKLGHLCDVAVRLDSRHSIPATSSNFSLRRDSDSFLISRSGKHKRDLHPSDFLLVDLQGKPCAPIAPKPSDETLLHALIYRKCPWVECITHCHAPELENLSPPSATLEGHELLKALGKTNHQTPVTLHVYENNQNMAELAELIEATQFNEIRESKNKMTTPKNKSEMAQTPESQRPAQTSGPVLFVLARHGIYCGGESIGKTEAYLEALLHLLKLKSSEAALHPSPN